MLFGGVRVCARFMALFVARRVCHRELGRVSGVGGASPGLIMHCSLRCLLVLAFALQRPHACARAREAFYGSMYRGVECATASWHTLAVLICGATPRLIPRCF